VPIRCDVIGQLGNHSMRATAFGFVVIFTGASLGLSILEASSQVPLSPAVSTTLPTPAEKLTDKLHPKWKLGGSQLNCIRQSDII
jgi:hypothetical protein